MFFHQSVKLWIVGGGKNFSFNAEQFFGSHHANNNEVKNGSPNPLNPTKSPGRFSVQKYDHQLEFVETQATRRRGRSASVFRTPSLKDNGRRLLCVYSTGEAETKRFWHRFCDRAARLPVSTLMNGKDLGSIIERLGRGVFRGKWNWELVRSIAQDIAIKIAVKMYYVTLLFAMSCTNNYIMKKGVDGKAVKKQFLAKLSTYVVREYPAGAHVASRIFWRKPPLREF